MGNQTTVTVGAVGLSLGGFIAWLMGIFVERSLGVPMPEEYKFGFAGGFMLLFCYLWPTSSSSPPAEDGQ